jgi:predicted aconitase with swiveling domain
VRAIAGGRAEGWTQHPGTARGPLLLLDEPLSLWGGTDAETGRVVDPRHPQVGACLAGHVVVMPEGRGSSSSSSVLVEHVRRGVAPAAIVLGRPDAVVALGAIVAAELYGASLPVIVIDPLPAPLAPGGVAGVVATWDRAVFECETRPGPGS